MCLLYFRIALLAFLAFSLRQGRVACLAAYIHMIDYDKKFLEFSSGLTIAVYRHKVNFQDYFQKRAKIICEWRMIWANNIRKIGACREF